MNDIAVYLSEEISYITDIPTLWGHKKSLIFWNCKYTIDDTKKLIVKNCRRKTIVILLNGAAMHRSAEKLGPQRSLQHSLRDV